MFIGRFRSALATVRSRHHSRQVPNALNGRGICPIWGSQMFVARAPIALLSQLAPRQGGQSTGAWPPIPLRAVTLEWLSPAPVESHTSR